MRHPVAVQLPLFQRFDCHGCGYCCHHLVVNVSAAERQHILDAGWAERLDPHTLFESYRFGGRRLYRLAHRPEGGCVFLDEKGRCRIHAETGLDAKPLACRLYPFVPTPGSASVRLDLRPDCPSVAGNQGRPVTGHQATIEQLVEEVGTRPRSTPVPWPGQRTLAPAEFGAVVSVFDRLLSHSSLPIRDRLRAGCGLLDLMVELRIERVSDDRFVELMTMLVESVTGGLAGQEPDDPPPLNRRSAKLFRQWLVLHALSDDPAELASGFFTRMGRSQRRYLHARRFVRGRGPVPMLDADWASCLKRATASSF